jgi:long-chain fatty acid transport protein
MRKRIASALLVAGLVLSAGLVQAAGFSIYEAGSRATALGGAFTASADDGSAIFYNAAGLSFLQGNQINVSVMPVMPSAKFSSAAIGGQDPIYGETEDKVFPIPGAYYTHNGGGKLSFGIGVYAPYGLGTKWENGDTWAGRQVSHDVSIETVYVTPAVSYLVTDKLAIAVGLDVAHQKLNLKKYSLYPLNGENALHTEIDGSSDMSFTPSFGLMYRPNDQWSFGAMYHFEKEMGYEDQDAIVENVATPGTDAYTWAATVLAGLGGGDHTITSEFNLPSILSLGAAYNFTDNFRLEGNYVYFGWDHFAKLDMAFDNPAMDDVIQFDYENAWQLRFGATYTAIPNKLDLMCGFVIDNTPQPVEAISPLLPDADKKDYSIGATYKTDKLDFTVSYMAVIGEERSNIEDGRPANDDPAYPVGSYQALANIFGFGVGYRF